MIIRLSIHMLSTLLRHHRVLAGWNLTEAPRAQPPQFNVLVPSAGRCLPPASLSDLDLRVNASSPLTGDQLGFA